MAVNLVHASARGVARSISIAGDRSRTGVTASGSSVIGSGQSLSAWDAGSAVEPLIDKPITATDRVAFLSLGSSLL